METHRAHLRDLRALTSVELDGKEKDLKRELFNLCFQFVAGRVDNPAKIKQTRRAIARVKTIAREKAKGDSGRASKEGT